MLSIIIPTFNEEECLPLLLKQIKKQSFKDFEIIVADAYSKDRTVEIAKSFGCKTVKGGLPAKGRNQGAKAAQGDIFLFMDADNIFLPQDFLEQFKANIDFAKKTGLKEFYLWGSEWWYWMKKKQNRPAIWDQAKKIF